MHGLFDFKTPFKIKIIEKATHSFADLFLASDF